MLKDIQAIVVKIKSNIEEGRPEEEVIQTIVRIINEDSEIASQVIEDMGHFSHPIVGRILQHLLENPWDKKIKKNIKRAIYRLKSRGVSVEEVSSKREDPILRPLQADPPRGFVGPFDFLGQRFLILVVPRVGRGFAVMQGIISDIEGLIDFSGAEMTRKRFKEFFEEVQKGGPFPLVEMEPSYVGYLFVEAYQLSLGIGKMSSQEYLQMKKEVESIKGDYDKSLIYSLLEEGEIERNNQLLERGGELLKMNLFSTWKLEERDIRPYADQVWEAEESKLILNQAQKEVRFQEIYQRALSDLFPEDRRSLYYRRLEEMAYYLFKSGKEEEARISLAVALDLKKPPNLIRPNPFLFHLTVKSIFAFLSEAYAKKQQEFSLIKKP